MISSEATNIKAASPFECGSGEEMVCNGYAFEC